MIQIRLDKYLSDLGVGSRAQVKDYIRKRRVSVNEEPVRSADYKIDCERDVVKLDGVILRLQEFEYYMLNKPKGVVSAVTDRFDTTVIDLLKDTTRRKGLFPVGRLDKDTEGLLLITNDGALEHALLSPKRHVDKVYFVKVEGTLTHEDVSRFEEGLPVEDYICLPAKLVILHSDAYSEAEVTLHEGKFHQVKKMFETVGKKVVYLKRISMGSLQLDNSLEPGEYRELTPLELSLLKNENRSE